MDNLASAPVGQMTRTGSMLGSPVYMSPEQARGKKTIDHRTDLWSLGVVVYEALTGAAPHAGAETLGDLIFQICGEAPRPVQEAAPWVPAPVAAIVHRALALDPAHRFATAREMFDAIALLLPAGYALDAKMFVSLSAEARAVRATHHSIPGNLRAPPPSIVSASSPGLSPELPVAVKASTTAGFASSTTGVSSGRSRLAVWFGAIAALGIAAGAFAVARHSPTSASTSPATAASPIASVQVLAPIAVPSASSEPPPSAHAIESPPSSAPAPQAPATGAPVASAVPPSPPAARPAARAPAAARPASAPAAKPDCNPPFTFDVHGTKVWKPECF
jgi:serine/threonine-protein kinase